MISVDTEITLDACFLPRREFHANHEARASAPWTTGYPPVGRGSSSSIAQRLGHGPWVLACVISPPVLLREEFFSETANRASTFNELAPRKVAGVIHAVKRQLRGSQVNSGQLGATIGEPEVRRKA